MLNKQQRALRDLAIEKAKVIYLEDNLINDSTGVGVRILNDEYY